MITFKLPPVFDSKHVLRDHIKAKLKQFILITVVNDIADELCGNKSNDELLKLLQDELLLKEAVLKIKINVNIKQKLGTELFAQVSQVDTSLCAQITGMLLELDVITICHLLSELDALEIAIARAKEEYTSFKQKTSKEFIGEAIYFQVLAQYPDHTLASRLTGMLLELDVNVLQQLLDDPKDLKKRTMANKKHQELAGFLKGVHQTLRLQSQTMGVDQAWLNHCQQTEMLKKYAESMKVLATEIWETNSGNDSELCRIQWVVDKCVQYFNCGGRQQAIHKEERLSQTYFRKSIKQCESHEQLILLYKLLDVGSCYNPFSKFPIFEVTALDLMPAESNVFECDFLSVSISSDIELISNPCTELPDKFFDIVVFSLLLEYFPSSKQRFKCCMLAYEVLKNNGLLFILTPDSKHANANSKMIKNWKFALASLGFWRVHYQKLKHLHCMSFRKCIDPQVPKYWLNNQQCQKAAEDLMYIPQDFNQQNKNVTDYKKEVRSDVANKFIADNFTDLPDYDIFS